MKSFNRSQQESEVLLQKAREFFVPIAVVVIVVIVSLLLGRPVWQRVLNQKNSNQKKAKQIAVMRQKLIKLNELDESQVDQQLLVLEKVFPSQKPAINLISNLSKLALESRIFWSGVTLNPGLIDKNPVSADTISEPSTSLNDVESFTLDFNVQGSLGDLLNYVSRLENTSPIMRIEKFALSLADNQDDKNSLDLTIRVYYQKLPQSIGAVEAPLVELSKEEKNIMAKLEQFVSFEIDPPVSPTGKDDIFAPIFSKGN